MWLIGEDAETGPDWFNNYCPGHPAAAEAHRVAVAKRTDVPTHTATTRTDRALDATKPSETTSNYGWI